MPKPVAEVGEGHEDASGNGVYCFIRDLIVEGRDARFVDKKGRYVINWSRALKCYNDYKSKRNPQYKSKNISRRKASNGLRAALLNFYKKEGAKEYKDSKKVNENDEVVERQFQMPPRVFESLFGSNVQLSDDSSEHETSSITSEADEKPLTTPNSSDTGFDEAMDTCISDDLFNTNEEPSSHSALGGLPAGDPLCSNVKTEEDQVDPSDITSPCQMFDISEEELDLVLGEICSNSDTNDIDVLGVVRDICPSSGSVKGGMQFYISLTEELSEDDKSGIAHFDGIGDVYLEKLNCYTLAGTIPASQQPGTVPVTVNTQDGHSLGITCFTYVDEILELLKQVVKDPALQSLYLTMWCQEYGFFGNDGNLDSFTLQGQGSSVQGTHTQALKGLQLLVYTAAQTNAQQFIQMIFSTSAGRLVFNAYKDRPQLPEDVARANGHDDLAQYLQDVNARLTKENSINAQPSSIDWLELIEAVNKIQKKSSVIEDETDLEVGQSKDDDDHESDYFADVETSSCGSFELEIGWSDSEDREGPCSKEGGSDKEPDVKSASSMNVMPCKACTCAEVETQSDNDLDLKDDKNSEEGEVKEVCDIKCFGQQIGVATQKRVKEKQEARACLDQEKCMQLKSPFTKDARPKKESDEGLTPSMEGTSSEAPTVLGTNLDSELDQKTDGKNDRNLGTTEVGKSSMISQLSKKVAEKRQRKRQRRGREKEASTVPSESTCCGAFEAKQLIYQNRFFNLKGTVKWLKGDALTTSSQQGATVNETQEVPSFRERSYQGVTGGGTQDSKNINDRKDDATTGPSQAKRHKQRTQWRPFRRTLLKSFFLLTISVITVLCLAAGIKLGEGQLLHWAVRNGHIRISQALLKFVSDVDAPNFLGETPLHLAAKSGYKDLAELLMKLGSNVNSKDYQQQTPLHLVALSGWQEIANALILHGSDVKARDDSQQTALHLAALNGHRNVLQILLQRGSDANAKQRLGWTPLHLASLAEHKEIGEVLVQHGSVMNITDNFGCTPLHLAAMKGHFQTVQFLLQLATNGRPKDRDGNEAMISHSFGFVDKCIQNGTNKLLICSELPVKEIAYERNHLAIAKVLLLYITLVSLCALLRIRLYYFGIPKELMEGARNGCQASSNSFSGHKQRTRRRPFRRTVLESFLLLTIAVITVLYLPAGIKLLGVPAHIEQIECLNEQFKLLEYPFTIADFQTETYQELQLRVTDSEHTKKQCVGYCNKILQCSRYRNMGSFDQRIKVSSPVRGKRLVKQMKLNDRLTYTCAIERNRNKGPVGNKIIVTSSKRCLSCTAGQDLDLGQTLYGMFSKELVEDIEWYRTAQDGTKVKMSYYSFSCLSFRWVKNCISSCPKYLKRLKIDGLSIILSNVTQADHGLEFEMQMQFKIMTKVPRVYTIKVKDFSPREVSTRHEERFEIVKVVKSILYKPWSERAGEIMNYLYDASNQVGCVAIPSKTGAVDVSEHDDEYVGNRTSQQQCCFGVFHCESSGATSLRSFHW